MEDFQATLDGIREKIAHQGFTPDDEWNELKSLRVHVQGRARQLGLDPESLAFEATWLLAADMLLEGFVDNTGSPLYQFFTRSGWNKAMNERRRLAFLAIGISPEPNP